MTDTTTAKPTGFASILETNKSEMSRISEYRDSKITTTPRNMLFGGMTIAGLFLFMMFATQIITGILALILTVGTVVGGFFGLRFLKAMDPVIQQKTRNTKLKYMVEEARKNAIYQLDNQVLANGERLQMARTARDKMGALVEQLRSKINPANKGTNNYIKKVELLERVKSSYEQMCDNLDKGASANNDFKRKVVEYKDMDSFANLANEAMSLMGASGNKDLEEMLSLESFNHIEGNFNEAIISIENSARDFSADND
jgi:hypothetical protein